MDHPKTVGLSFSVQPQNQEDFVCTTLFHLCSTFIQVPRPSIHISHVHDSPVSKNPGAYKFRNIRSSLIRQLALKQGLCPFLGEFWNDWYLFWTREEFLVNHKHPAWNLALGIYPVVLTHCPDLHLWIYIILISICVFVCTCVEWLWNATILVW